MTSLDISENELVVPVADLVCNPERNTWTLSPPTMIWIKEVESLRERRGGKKF